MLVWDNGDVVVADFFSVYVYFGLVVVVTLATIGFSALFPSNKSNPTKFMPYESGIQTETNLLQQRFPLRHYLVALIFLVFDIEVIFFYPWAVVGKKIGQFAFYEMAFFLLVLTVGFAYVWKKGGLEWE
jgi:NADH-quinone oxidoreductase subunit A